MKDPGARETQIKGWGVTVRLVPVGSDQKVPSLVLLGTLTLGNNPKSQQKVGPVPAVIISQVSREEAVTSLVGGYSVHTLGW